ncbi:MAG: hypothetical protein N4A57_14510, partial [Anaeromicrobium sp.]|uniref:GLUG motif-containing protein n=1 Tax=Anaeromicrobium sp. TaxID=1929132 RepID=UPI0025E8803F
MIQVRTKEDLKNVKTNLSGSYKLMNDIDLQGENWEPIGAEKNPFKGTLDGNGFVIKNLTINKSEQKGVGLFSYVEDAKIINITLENPRVKGHERTAGLIGSGKGSSIENSHIKKKGQITGNNYIGGIIGLGENIRIIGCSATDSIIK